MNNNFDFKLFKNFEECGDHWVTAGRMQPLQFEEKKGIIVSTSTGPKSKDTPGDQPQDDFSIFGKIIFIDLDKKNHFIFTKGHRETQGLYVKENIILSTEHGPRGGDEVNKLIFNSNYGWPLASYGEAYYDKEKKYLKSHVENGFKEPLISFVPSIGISELIIVPHDFSPSWGNSVFVTSLNGKSIYRLQFESKEYKNILLTEKIYIGQRIRDIKYIPNKNVFFLALENFGEIGILEKVN